MSEDKDMLITKDEIHKVEMHENLKVIADYIDDTKPDAVKRRYKILGIGVVIGISLCMIALLLIWVVKPTKYVTYITFYIQEKGGIRPASLQYNGRIETTADLEAVESLLLKKYDNGKITNIMLFGTPIVLKKVDIEE